MPSKSDKSSAPRQMFLKEKNNLYSSTIRQIQFIFDTHKMTLKIKFAEIGIL